METEIFAPDTIATDDAASSGITNTTGVYNYINAPTPIFTINPTKPTPEVEPYPTTEVEPDDEYDE